MLLPSIRYIFGVDGNDVGRAVPAPLGNERLGCHSPLVLYSSEIPGRFNTVPDPLGIQSLMLSMEVYPEATRSEKLGNEKFTTATSDVTYGSELLVFKISLEMFKEDAHPVPISF